MAHPSNDEIQDRVTAAIEEADCGSNHQAGVDGDDGSAADLAAEDDDQSHR